MKKTLLCLLIILIVICLCSCDEISNGSVKQANSLDVAIECLGSVNEIYERSTAKFVTGETLLNYEHEDNNVVFIGKLIEYNELTKSFADYVEKITKEENALMHQHYNVLFNSNKKYVEFCAYVDKQTGIVQEYEIRVFNGDFVNREGGEWYAKSCFFNNTFTRDLSNNCSVDFGFQLDVVTLNPATLPTSKYTYDYSTGELTITNEDSTEETVAPEYEEALEDEVLKAVKLIGTVAKIFDKDEKARFFTLKNKGYYSCLVEYSCVKDGYTRLFDKSYAYWHGYDAMNFSYHTNFGEEGQTFNEGSTYIEVTGVVNSKTGKIGYYDLRRINPEAYKKWLDNGSSTTEDYFATSIDIEEI